MLLWGVPCAAQCIRYVPGDTAEVQFKRSGVAYGIFLRLNQCLISLNTNWKGDKSVKNIYTPLSVLAKGDTGKANCSFEIAKLRKSSKFNCIFLAKMRKMPSFAIRKSGYASFVRLLHLISESRDEASFLTHYSRAKL